MSTSLTPPRLNRVAKRNQTRAALLDAAATMFAARGIHATTLDAIAETAGLTKGAVYSNFAGKDALIQALLETRAERDGQRWMAAFANADDGDRLTSVADVASSSMHSDREWIALEMQFHLYALHNEAAREKLASHYARVRQAIATAIAGQAGLTEPELVTVSRGLPALSLGLGILAQLESNALSVAVWRELLERMIVGVKAGLS